MAKKKTTKSEQSPLISISGETPPMPMPDRRTLDKTMAHLQRMLDEKNFGSIEEAKAYIRGLLDGTGGFLPDLPAATAIEQAQDIMYQAWEARTKAKRVSLARKALEISPDCADAYVLLAEETAQSDEEALKLYEQGVQAGERAIGPEGFKSMKGQFWGFIETRPYMRAREGLALCLYRKGDLGAAISHLVEMLKLNPNDNQGVRYLLCDFYLEAGDDKALEKLLRKYNGDYSASWKYTSALLAFRMEGKGEKAAKTLKAALKFNPFVPPYLLGTKKFPKNSPPYISPGQDDEALDYAIGAKAAWERAPGALEWLAEAAKK